eukprot:7552985-Prorocentrum_lima.AAC.1
MCIRDSFSPPFAPSPRSSLYSSEQTRAPGWRTLLAASRTQRSALDGMWSLGPSAAFPSLPLNPLLPSSQTPTPQPRPPLGTLAGCST